MVECSKSAGAIYNFYLLLVNCYLCLKGFNIVFYNKEKHFPSIPMGKTHDIFSKNCAAFAWTELAWEPRTQISQCLIHICIKPGQVEPGRVIKFFVNEPFDIFAD